MKNKQLFDVIYESFGLNGKSIQLVNKRKIENIETISSISRTKDGLNILNHYVQANPDDIIAQTILNEVARYEKVYGDGTSLLTMILVFLAKERESIAFKKDSVIRDIDTILSEIEKQILPKKDVDKNYIDRFVKTVCKQDKICDKLIQFIKEHKDCYVGSIGFTNKPETDEEVIFLPKKGYFVSCYVERRYISSHYSRFTNAVFHLIDGELTEEKFQELESQCIQSRTRYVVVCKNYSDETAKLITETVTPLIMVIRYMSSEKSELEIKQDLRYLFDLKDLKDGSGSIGSVKKVLVNEDGAYFMEPPRKYDELEEYCKSIKEEFMGNDLARNAMLYRIRNILSNNSFDILVNSNTYTRQNVLKDMLDDLFKSLPHFKKGLIKGCMSYVSLRHYNGGKVIQILRIIKEKLIDGLNHHNAINKHAEQIVPIDLLENAKAIFKIVKEFCLELLDTYEVPIVSNRNWR